jgi:penicillin-insensitive murein endopeptidase
METFLADRGHVNPKVWTPDYVKLLRRSVSYPEVARIFVNPAIKKWLCDNVKDDRAFLRKITPIMGHDDHFHVRLFCPADNPGCRNQAELPADEGCGKGLDNWIAQLLKPAAPPKTPAAPGAPKTPAARVTSTPAPVVPVASKPSPAPAKPGAAAKPGTPAKPGTAAKPKGKTAITLADLPPECQAVLNAPALAATAQ